MGISRFVHGGLEVLGESSLKKEVIGKELNVPRTGGRKDSAPSGSLLFRAWGRGVRTIGGDVCGAWGVLCIYDYVGLGKLYISGKV